VALELGELDVAEAYLQASLCAAQYKGRLADAAATLYELGMLAFQRGDTQLARTRFEDSLGLIGDLNDHAKVASVRLCLGIVALHDHDFDGAFDHMLFSLELSQADRDEHAIADVLDALACLAAARGDVERAMRVYGAAQALHDKVGMLRSAFKQASLDAWLGASVNNAGTLLAAGRAMPLERAVELALAIADLS
jgi:tetratricopeptide (TPR) repeat protein